jgi:cephalosporin hydroxylase
VIEIGARHGGSALWFADMLAAHGIEGRVISVDLQPPELVDHRIRFVAGDARDLDGALQAVLLRDLEHPWLVSEDSAHHFETTLAVLRFFDRHLHVGDHIVVEDGILRQFSGEHYRRYDDGPNRAVQAFLAETGGRYAVDEESCDLYGYNYTWNPNGYLVRVA